MDPTCWLKKKKGSRLSKPSAWGNFSASPWLSAEQDQLSCGVHRSLFWQLLKRWKLPWFGHVTRHNSLSKTILQGTLEGGQHRDWPKKSWIDNIKAWTSLPMPELLTRASCRKDWKGISTVSSLTFIQWPYWLRVWTELKVDQLRRRWRYTAGWELADTAKQWNVRSKGY